MATANYEYNEVSHSCVPTGSGDINGLDPMYHYDTHFPERMSRLHMAPEYNSPVARRSKARARNRNASRFKTQPITFDEIKEVDEESSPAIGSDIFDKTKEGLKYQFTAFSRSMDGILPSIGTGKMERLSPLTGGSTTTNPAIDTAAADAANAQSTAINTSSADCDDDANAAAAAASPAATQEASGFQIPAGLPTHDTHARNRRKMMKKNKHRDHNRSIEEAPELIKSEDSVR